jgi:cytochrome P450
MADYESVDFFTDESLLEDPYPYFDHLRAQCPIHPTPHHGVVAVSGYEEASEIYLNNEDFSSCNSVIGPFATFPVPLEGDDVSDIIDNNREVLPMYEHMVTMDPPQHTQERSLIMRLLTPKRLKENEAFMWQLADRQIDEFVGDGHCEFISAYTQPFAMLVVADVLGVPESDHQRFREGFGLGMTPGKVGTEGKHETSNALGWCDDWFTQYIEDRR